MWVHLKDISIFRICRIFKNGQMFWFANSTICLCEGLSLLSLSPSLSSFSFQFVGSLVLFFVSQVVWEEMCLYFLCILLNDSWTNLICSFQRSPVNRNGKRKRKRKELNKKKTIYRKRERKREKKRERERKRKRKRKKESERERGDFEREVLIDRIWIFRFLLFGHSH